MSNKYIKEASEKNSKKFLPDTFEEFCELHPSDASRIPMGHIQKLRKELNERNSSNESSFSKNPIKWD